MGWDGFLNALITLLVTIDPPGLVPIFIAATMGMDKAQRRQTAFIAAIISFGIFAVFAFAGAAILQTLGISLSAFRIAGGILLFCIAFEMIFEKRTERKGEVARTIITRDQIHNIAAFPLAMPMISGPGAISATILMATNNHGWSGTALTLAVLIIATFICYLFMILSGMIERILGSAGRSILTRLFGVLLAALAVQFVADGVHAIFIVAS